LHDSDAVALRDHLQALLDAHKEAHHQHELAHDREHRATELAISKAESVVSTALARSQETTDERFKAANAWRMLVTEREREFLQKTEYNPRHEVLVSRVDTLEDRAIALATRDQERERASLKTMSLIGLLAVVGGFVLSLVVRLIGIV
jgi:hypothetical protein